MKKNNRFVIERLKNEAMGLVLQRGVRGWNMSQLASRAGIAKDTLYRIFPSKEELIKEILIDQVLEYQGAVERIAGEGRGYRESLEEVVLLFAEFASRLASDGVKEVLCGFPGIEAELSRAQNLYYDSMTRFLEEGRRNGFFRPDLDTSFLLRVFNGFTLHYLKYADKESIKEDLKMLGGYLIEGIKARGEES